VHVRHLEPTRGRKGRRDRRGRLRRPHDLRRHRVEHSRHLRLLQRELLGESDESPDLQGGIGSSAPRSMPVPDCTGGRRDQGCGKSSRLRRLLGNHYRVVQGRGRPSHICGFTTGQLLATVSTTVLFPTDFTSVDSRLDKLLATVSTTVLFSTDFTSVDSRLDSYSPPSRPPFCSPPTSRRWIHDWTATRHRLDHRSALHRLHVGGGGEVGDGSW